MNYLNRFQYLCDREELDPVSTFHDLVKKYVEGRFPPPFNVIAREKAGMSPQYYEPLAHHLMDSRSNKW